MDKTNQNVNSKDEVIHIKILKQDHSESGISANAAAVSACRPLVSEHIVLAE